MALIRPLRHQDPHECWLTTNSVNQGVRSPIEHISTDLPKASCRICFLGSPQESDKVVNWRRVACLPILGNLRVWERPRQSHRSSPQSLGLAVARSWKSRECWDDDPLNTYKLLVRSYLDRFISQPVLVLTNQWTPCEPRAESSKKDASCACDPQTPSCGWRTPPQEHTHATSTHVPVSAGYGAFCRRTPVSAAMREAPQNSGSVGFLLRAVF